MSVEFHPLRVAAVEPLTDDAVAVTFDVPAHLRDTFSYLPGQHVTLRAEVEGADVRRSYSICANANTRMLRVGVKRLDGGVFSTWITKELRPGDLVDVMAPVGEFTLEPDPESTRHYAAVAAGSGITPVLSLMSTTLEAEPHCQWTLLFGNRSVDSIMFFDEVEGLKDTYPDRVHLVHVLSREQPEIDLYAGRIDEEKLQRFFSAVLDPESVDRWYLCGPYEMVLTTRRLLEDRGTAGEHIRDELFFAGPPDPSQMVDPEEVEGSVRLRVKLGGRTTETRMEPDMSVLDAALRVRSELPFSCKGGMCASCKAHLLEGDVEMAKNYALVDSELASGYILTCQSHPLGEEVSVDYDV